MSSSGKCIILSAPSGAGKTTMVHRLLAADLGLEFSVSATSRAMRPNERNGKDYWFMSPEGKSLPFFKNFFAGGNNSVLGYNLNSLGPRDETLIGNSGQNLSNTNSAFLAVGASKRVVGNIELMFPVPFMKDDRSLRLSLFLDGGTTFNKFHDTTVRDSQGKPITQDGLGNLMRYSAGLAVTWVPPRGPLKVSVAQPLNDQPTDSLQRFQFMFGQQF